MNPILAAIYARVSSQRQKEERTIGSQTAALKEFAQAHPCAVPEGWIFEDEGYSGATLARPGLERLRDLVNEGQVDVVLVHSPDRLSRRYAYQVLLLEEFARKGVEVLFLKGNAGQTPEEQLLVQFQGMIAEYERAQIAERCRRGKRHRARAGSVNVLSGAPYGYRYLKRTDGSDSCYVIHPDEAVVVRQVYHWYTQDGLSIGAIARALSEQKKPTRTGRTRWERSTVWAMLRNPAYAGRAAYGKTRPAQRARITRRLREKGGFSKRSSANRERPREQWIEIAVPALICERVFEIAQERMANNQRLSRKNTREITLLQGLLVCEQCGYAWYRTSTRTTKRQAKYYRCLGSDRWRHLRETPCACRPIRVEDLDDVVWGQVEKLLENPALIRAELGRRREESLRGNPNEQRRQRLEADIRRIGQQIDKLLDAYQEGLLGLAELRQRMPALRSRKTAAEKELESAHWQKLADEQLRELHLSLESFLGQIRKSAQNLSVADRQKIIRLLVKEIIIGKDTITVRHCLSLTNSSADPPGEHHTGQPDQTNYQVCTRRHDSTLRRALFPLFGLTLSHLFHGSLLEEAFDQPKHPPVGDALARQRHEALVRDVVEIVPPRRDLLPPWVLPLCSSSSTRLNASLQPRPGRNP